MVGQSKFFVNENATGANNGTSWNDAFTNLQDAIDACGGQLDTIWVAAGKYIPNKRLDQSTSRTETFLLNKKIALFGGFSGIETKLSERNPNNSISRLSGDLNNDNSLNNNAVHVVVIDNKNVLLDGFTISDGYANKNIDGGSGVRGAGVYHRAKGGEVINCYFSNNHSKNSGGNKGTGAAIYLDEKSELTVEGCSFISNTVPHAGSVIELYKEAKLTLYDCEVNNAQGGKGGVVTIYEKSELNIFYSNFNNNSSSSKGGVIYAEKDCKLEITGSNFLSNAVTSTGEGGVLYLTESEAIIKNSNFSNNSSSNRGGAIYAYKSEIEISNSKFISNNGGGNGGAIYAIEDTDLELNGCEFSQNQSSNPGGAIYSQKGDSELNFCTFKLNSTNSYSGGSAIYSEETKFEINNVLVEKHQSTAFNLNNGAEINFSNCIFYDNDGQTSGAIYVNNAKSEFINCVIINNSGTNSAAAVKHNNSDATYVNCVIAYNSVNNGYGSGVDVSNGEIEIYNSILYQNTNNNGVKDFNNNLKAYDSFFTDKTPSSGNNNTKNVNPQFTSINNPKGADNKWFTKDDGFSLSNSSTLINQGNNKHVKDYNIDYDITGYDRKEGNDVEPGAYENATSDWDYSGSGIWHDKNNWADNKVPNKNSNIFLDHENSIGNYTVTIDEDAEVNNIVFSSSGITLILENGVTLEYGEIQGVGKIVLEEHASLVPQNGKTGNVAGDFTVKRTKPNSWKFYNFWSSPVENGSISMLADAQAVFTMEKGTGNPSTVYTTIGSDSTMEVGRGYTAANVSDAQFTGLVNNGIITYDVSDENGAFNLIGNPYPSAISAQQFVSDNELILKDGTIWMWDQQEVNNGSTEYNTTTNFIAVNATGASSTGHRTATLASTDIASCQGFVVSADANGMVEFNNDQRNGENSNFKSGNNTTLENKELAWISLTYDDYKSTTLIGFGEQATSGFDFYYDTHGNVVKNGMQIGTTIKNDLFLINTYNNHTEELNIPLSVTIDHYKASVKTFEISLDDSENLSDTRTIYLKDNETGNIYNLSKDSTVAFPVTESFFDQERFEIISELNTTGINNNHNNWFTSSINNNTITVNSSYYNSVELMMYDVTGKLIAKQQLGANQSVELNLTKHVDIIHIVGNDINWTRKIK